MDKAMAAIHMGMDTKRSILEHLREDGSQGCQTMGKRTCGEEQL